MTRAIKCSPTFGRDVNKTQTISSTLLQKLDYANLNSFKLTLQEKRCMVTFK